MRSKLKKLLAGLTMCLALSTVIAPEPASARIMADGCYWLVSESGQILGVVCCQSDYCTVRWV